MNNEINPGTLTLKFQTGNCTHVQSVDFYGGTHDKFIAGLKELHRGLVNALPKFAEPSDPNILPIDIGDESV